MQVPEDAGPLPPCRKRNRHSTTTMTTVAPPPVSPPLARILPYLSTAGHGLVASLTATLRAAVFLTKTISYPIYLLSPLPIILYLLAPLIVFAQILFEATVLSPFKIFVYLADALYPLYVFVGVACITGALVGYACRLGALYAVLLVKDKESIEEDEVKTVKLEAKTV